MMQRKCFAVLRFIHLYTMQTSLRQLVFTAYCSKRKEWVQSEKKKKRREFLAKVWIVKL